MRFTVFLLAAFTLLHPSLAAPQLFGELGTLIGELLQQIPLLSNPPPAALMTKQPSPECANVNKGALLCCQSSFQGDIPIFVQAAPLVAYKLNPNSINCIYGMSILNLPMSNCIGLIRADERTGTRNVTDCSRGVELCCQVDALATVSTQSADDSSKLLIFKSDSCQ